MPSDGNTDPGLLLRFREEVDTYLLTIQQDLVTLEQDPHNAELLREIMRAAHTVKGAAQVMGFRQIARVMHKVENVVVAMRDGELEVSQQRNDLLFEALDTVDTLTKAEVNRQQLPLDTENLIRHLEQSLQRELEVGTASSASGGARRSACYNGWSGGQCARRVGAGKHRTARLTDATGGRDGHQSDAE